ncbi:hypothetical protein CDL15_Pgr028139 [Punica granatum]|uniref:Uncharacterized protein n=1 Tax=Punica granatum TaxID=22663 RepID=A0A218Y1A3_PUNGR|nr:hypothetical protein CDL15_Pgr028139 [Punica granatum]
MDKNDPLVPHTSCGQGIPKESGQVIYFNMILDHPSNTAQLSSAKDFSSSTVGKPSMPSKQLGTTYTTEERRKMGVHLTAGVNPCILLAWGNVLPKLSLFSLSLHNSKWVTATLQQAITEPKSQTFLSESLVITLWKWYYKHARTTADSDSRPLGIRRRSTPELESFTMQYPAKKNPSPHSRGIASESTMAKQQSRLPAKVQPLQQQRRSSTNQNF